MRMLIVRVYRVRVPFPGIQFHLRENIDLLACSDRVVKYRTGTSIILVLRYISD